MIDPRFELTDHNGRRVDQASFYSRFALVFFGLTKCPVVCPRALTKLSQALDLVGEDRGRISALYITVDPDADTPEALATFLQRWPAFTGLTGSRDQIDGAKRSFRVFSARHHDEGGEYRISHSAFAHLLDPSGRHVAHWADTLSAEEVAGRLRKCVEAYVKTCRG